MKWSKPTDLMAEDVKLARVEALVDDDVRFVVDVVWRFRVVLLVIDFCLKWKKEKHFFRLSNDVNWISLDQIIYFKYVPLKVVVSE